MDQLDKILKAIPADIENALETPPPSVEDGDLVAVCTKDTVRYGWAKIDNQRQMRIEEVVLDDQRVPHLKGASIPWLNAEVVPVVWWKAAKEEHPMAASDDWECYKEPDRVIGPLIASYPRAEGWLLNGQECDLNEMTIKNSLEEREASGMILRMEREPGGSD